MIKSKIEKALNKQINVEFNAFYSYLSMAAYFESRQLLGTANWFKFQSNEEFKHAMKFNAYVMARGGKVLLTTIESPQTDWKSCTAVFEQAYAQEQRVSASINSLYELCSTEHDYATEIMLQWFITEQVEEEVEAKRNLDNFKFIKDSSEGIVLFDQQLGQRK